MKRDLYFVGDIHGVIRDVLWNLTDLKSVKSADIVFVGDFGVGFDGRGDTDLSYRKIHEKLVENDLMLYVVRGNHDNPEYFDGKHDYERLKFLEDHKVYEIGGKSCYIVGGAISIDRAQRILENIRLESKSSISRVYWEDEGIKKKWGGLPESVDIIVSHEAPLSVGPPFIPVSDKNLSEQIIRERQYLNFVRENVKHESWYYGHHHDNYFTSLDNASYYGLAIEEVRLEL